MLIVETWPVARLIPYARNPRRNDAAIEKMCGAIREFGFRIPVVARSDGTVVDGHLRLKAAQQLGLDMVPVALADDLSEAQIKAFRLLANRSAAWAEWDDELLTLELQELQEAGYDLGLTGFDVAELRSLLDDAPTTGLTDENLVPGTPIEPLTKPGDVILLGPHRLLCGDATRADDVARLLEGACPHLMVTDPPYGVDYDPCWRNAAGISATRRTGRVSNDDRADWREAWLLFPGDVAYVWHAAMHATTVADSLLACGFELRAQIVWSKNRSALSRGDYHWQHEPCWYAVRNGTRSHWQGARDQSTLWSMAALGTEDAATPHGTQKPVEAMRRPIVNNSARDDAIYEPFCGSGTTLIAAETVGRVCLAMELEPAYCDVIVERWQVHRTNGHPPVLLLLNRSCSPKETDMAGRKPIPTTLKLVRGTARPHRMNHDEPMPPACVPEPPAHLDARARAKFAEIAGMLAGCGVMTVLDCDALARYCVIWCRWVDAEAEIKRKGPIVKTEAGNVIHSPYLAVANRCHRQLAQLESEFGLTPSSRSRVRAASPAIPRDPIADRYFDF